MSILKFLGGSVAILYIVCAILALLSSPASADDGVSLLASVGSMIDRAPVWLQGASMLVAAAASIAAVTPTPKDDGVLMVLRKVLDVVAFNVMRAKNQSLKDKANELVDKK